MYDFFDKHGKKFLAVVGSLLVLVFLMPGNMGRGGGMTRHFGTIGGRQIDGDAIALSQAAFTGLFRLSVPGRSRSSLGDTVPLPLGVFPEQVFGNLVEKFRQTPLLWYLLVREATDAGATPDDQRLDTLLNSPQVTIADGGTPVALKDVTPQLRESFRSGLRDVIAVSHYFNRRSNSVKATAPMIDDALASAMQQVRARVAVFSATAFQPAINAPSDDELRAQLDAYANDAPGVPTTRNPFGFGYLIADKLRLQWIAVPTSEVARVVESTKTAELWDEDAIIFYQKNQQLFQSAAQPPSVAPPATRPFEEAKADVLSKMRQPQIDQLQRQIVNRVIQQMTVDAQKVREKAPTTQQAAEAMTNYGVAFGSFDYLQKLADDVQKQFGVKLSTVSQALPLTKIELQAVGGIGATSPDDIGAGSAMGQATGPGYLFGLCKPLLAPENQGQLGAFDLLQPTKVLKGDNALYVARATEVEPAHAPRSLDEVRAAVGKDVRDKKAFGKAAEAAQAAISGAAAAGGLEKVGGAKVWTSDWFGPAASSVTGISAIDDSFDVVKPIFEQLRGVKSVSDLPRRTVVKRQAKGEVLAVELFAVQTRLNTDDAAAQRLTATDAALRDVASPLLEYKLIGDWFSIDGVSRRIGFEPDAASRPAPGTPATPPPGNPFLPG